MTPARLADDRIARVARAAAVAYAACAMLGGCLDNPHGRPATLVDGAAFPDALRGVISPAQGFADGAAVAYYVLEPIESASVSEVIEPIGADGQPLPPCRLDLRDADGVPIDPDLGACQGPIAAALPGDADYSPFARVIEARMPEGYPLNAARSREEVIAAGGALTATDRIVDVTIVDPSATVVDTADAVPRLGGWMRTLQLVYVSFGGASPDGDGVAAMDVLVPEGSSPGDPGVVLQARAGDADYSTLCRVVQFAVPVDFQPGDYRDADDVPAEDRIPSDPPQFVHCGVP